MKKSLLILPCLMASLSAFSQSQTVLSAWDHYLPEAVAYDRVVSFDVSASGKKLPILWGFDTAWNSPANMLRGVRFAGRDAISCARVSFQPWALITQKGVLPYSLQKNLDSRMETVSLIGKKVDIVLNLDGGDNTIKGIYGGYKYENPDDPWWSPKEYIGDVKEQGPRWADLIDATAAAVEAKGYTVITASPLNEPDLEVNGTPIELFYEIAKSLKDYTAYPRFRNIRISGGNTLNNDEADRWYEYNKEFLDEGNTHQLAGGFDSYAAFFQKVRQDGKHASADELHNVMEAMVGVEYGMQTGIWWGTAERVRGEFMKASFGDRLGYAENRFAWSSASVYRSPEDKIQGFVGCSERQARPSSFGFVSASAPFFANGVGPLREYVVNVPGDPNGAYQTTLQRTAEAVFDFTQGLDIQPELNGDFHIINKASKLLVSCRDGVAKDGSDVVQAAAAGRPDQTWNITPVPETWGGDFSYYFIKNINGKIIKSLDDNNWNLDAGGKVITYGFSGGAIQQWVVEYVGDGYFRIRNRHSALYLTVADTSSGTIVTQEEYDGNDRQLWHLIPATASIEYVAPTVPSGLTASARTGSIELSWQPSTDQQAVTYAIARADGASPDFNIIARGLADTRFLDNSLSSATDYRYMVMAEDAALNHSAFSPAVSVSISEKDMIAHYKFEESVVDETVNRLDIRLVGAPYYRDGLDDSSMSLFLRSKAYCQLPYSATASDEFTVSLWFKLRAEQQGLRLFSTGLDNSQCLELIPYSGSNMELRAVNGSETASVAIPTPDLKEWTHVAIVASGGEVNMYVNGVATEDGNPAAVSKAMPNARPLSYLFSDLNHEAILSGFVDDTRIYNKALSSDEIKAMVAEVSGVGLIASDTAEIVAVEYYAPSGIRLSQPSESGLTIVRTVFADGSAKVEKIVK